MTKTFIKMSSSSNGGSPSSDSSSSSSSSPSNNSKFQSPSFKTEDSSSSDNNNNNNNNNNSSSQSPPPNNDSSSGKDNNSSSSNNNNDNNNNNNNSNNNNSNSQSPPPSNNDGKNDSSPPNDNNNNNNNNNNSNNNNGNNNNGNNNNNNNSGNKSPPPSSPPPKSSNSSKSPLSPPPPPSPSSLNYSPNSRPLSPPKTESTDSVSKDTTAAIKIGVAAGAGVLFIVMIIFLISCCKRKKKRKQNQMKHNQMGYYQDNSRGAMNNHYYNNNNNGMHGNNWQNSNKFQPADQFYKIPPPPGSAQVSSEHSWPIAPPPPPPMMSSSELSSAAFSGPHQPPMPPPHPAMALGYNQSSFTYDDLAVATGGFAKDKLLGQGGFGYVHKGVLPNGKEVAVKSLKSNSGQGEREFQAEVDIISRVHHRHLVSLVGYCIAGSQRMLVYEFVVNNTLEYHLHGPGRPPMDFNTRHKIALGAAKGFAYLHEDCHPKIIHRDIKAANILLDENFEAKVADFGLAKLSTDNHTHVSTRIMGTFGYLAPEYASSGKLTEKSDVYSYGVMLLELITGRRPVDMEGDDDTLVEWARPILLRATEGGDYDELIDPSLEGKFDAQQMLCMVACAAATIRHSAKKRPKMSQIVRALEDEVTLDDLDEGGKLGHNATSSSSGSSEHDGGSYDLKKFRKSSMSSQEYSSSENGESREYRQNKK
ncbi:putative proline-rich receptor-like protein kinase PERK6 [Capsicum chacoense]|nr:putative proline-rich receptor-like protein kinase PERK6 [Capsicum annuum]